MFSDLHVDFDYTPGNSNTCGNPLCCRSDSGKPRSPDQAAGLWGDFKCDLSPKTMTNLFSFIKNQIKPDVVLWTGDSIPHNIESVTFDETVNNMARVSREVADGLKGIPIYAAPGNHDTYPADIFLGHYAQENAAFTEWAKDWDSFSFLKDPEQMKNFNDFGYYSAPLVFANGTQIGKNFSKVISINSNFYYQANFELTV